MITDVLGSSAPIRPAQRSRAVLLAHWIRQRAMRWRTRRELAALPDDLLRDIGVSRCGIDAVAAGRTDLRTTDLPRRL